MHFLEVISYPVMTARAACACVVKGRERREGGREGGRENKEWMHQIMEGRCVCVPMSVLRVKVKECLLTG